MSLFDNPDQILLLQKLLNPKANKNDSDTDEEGSVQCNRLNPGNIGAQPAKTEAPKKAIAVPEEKIPQSIDEWQALQEKEDAEILETRKVPDYTMTYRQAVGPEDVYLQLSNRTQSSASCEDLIVEILLPDETTPADKMDLSITEAEVDLATPIYRLKLPLPHKVNVDRCRAKYNAALHKLCLTLRLQREFDFVNF